MIALEDPPGFVVRTEAQKAAWDNGFRLERGIERGGSATARPRLRGSIWIAGASELALGCCPSTHAGVAAEIGRLPASPVPGPGIATFMFANLRSCMPRSTGLRSRGEPAGGPPRRFNAKTANLPRTTEAERMVIQRIGQDVFRDALMDYWGGRCPLTGITERGLLRASHIVPWAECNDAQRLDVHNGLLLSALWDAAFDRGLVSFADDGTVACSSLQLGEPARKALGIATAPAPSQACAPNIAARCGSPPRPQRLSYRRVTMASFACTIGIDYSGAPVTDRKLEGPAHLHGRWAMHHRWRLQPPPITTQILDAGRGSQNGWSSGWPKTPPRWSASTTASRSHCAISRCIALSLIGRRFSTISSATGQPTTSARRGRTRPRRRSTATERRAEGNSRWRRLTEETRRRREIRFSFRCAGISSKIHPCRGPLGCASSAQRLGDRVHFWRFDGWEIARWALEPSPKSIRRCRSRSFARRRPRRRSTRRLCIALNSFALQSRSQLSRERPISSPRPAPACAPVATGLRKAARLPLR